MRVAVTGGAGFLGSAVVDRLLLDGDEVLVFDDLSRGDLANLAAARSRGKVRFHRLDVTQGDLGAVAARGRVDAWVHLAARTDPVRAWTDPVSDAGPTLAAAIAVLGVAAANGARVVLASSAAYVYPDGGDRVCGADAPMPLHPFGAARVAVDAYAGAFAARGLDVTTLLLGSLYGPRQDAYGSSLVARCARLILAGDAPVVEGDGHQTRDFVFVKDAADAVARAARAEDTGRVTVGTGVTTTVLEVVERLSALLGRASEPAWSPPRPGDPRGAQLDTDAASALLGWRASTTLEAGLGRTIEWTMEHQPLGLRKSTEPPA